MFVENKMYVHITDVFKNVLHILFFYNNLKDIATNFVHINLSICRLRRINNFSLVRRKTIIYQRREFYHTFNERLIKLLNIHRVDSVRFCKQLVVFRLNLRCLQNTEWRRQNWAQTQNTVTKNWDQLYVFHSVYFAHTSIFFLEMYILHIWHFTYINKNAEFSEFNLNLEFNLNHRERERGEIIIN